MTWNYCQHVRWPTDQLIKSPNIYAYLQRDSALIPLTTSDFTPQITSTNNGVIFTQQSPSKCDGTNAYSFTTELACSTGATKVLGVDTTGCDVRVMIESKAGCMLAADFSLTEFMQRYPWLFGLIMIVSGPFVAFYGRRYLPKVIAGIVFISSVVGMLALS